MKKVVFMILIILFVSGCSVEYKLNIKNGDITEEINAVIDKNKFTQVETEDNPDPGLYTPETLVYILNGDVSPLITETNAKYEKIVKENGNFADINLKYTYAGNTYKDSFVINTCFERVAIAETKKEIKIKLSGEYTCLDDDSDSMLFAIETSNKVNSNNAEKSSFGNYSWEISRQNKDNVNIEITMLKQSIYVYYGIRIAIGAVIIGAIMAIYALVAKIRDRDSLNEI